VLISLLGIIIILSGLFLWIKFKDNHIRSIAVIPFENTSQDPSQDFFVDGMTNALRANLGKVSALKVIWNKSTSLFENSDKSINEIGKELGVDALVIGSVSKLENTVMVNAQLVRTDNEELIWGESFSRDLTKSLKLQSEIAQNIVNEIQILITADEKKKLQESIEVDPKTLELIFKGLSHLYKLNPEHYDIALDYFNQVIQIDSLNAQAYAGIGLVWIHKGQWGGEEPLGAGEKARIAASRALELDSNLPMAHLAMAQYYVAYAWDWEQGSREYQKTIEINGSLSEPRAFYADLLVSLHRFDEALEQVNEALKVDPLNATIHMLSGWALLASRKYELAIQTLNRSLELEPNLPLSHRCLWTIYHQRKEYDLAIQHAISFYKNQDLSEIAQILKTVFEEKGYHIAVLQAAEKLASLFKTKQFSAMRIARLYAFSGDHQLALEWLVQAYQEHYVSFSSLNVDPHWETLHSTPIFQDLVGKMNLTVPVNY
jgi:TolB-like protein